jgi:DNA-binding transcriptional LysR family regulator
MRLSIYSLQLFVAVVEEGTIAAAAERENIAASALSKRISELERMVGTPLLLRKARGVEPTAAGQILVRGARRLLHQADDVAAEVRNFATGESGHVRVAANLSSITQFLAQDIGVFNASDDESRLVVAPYRADRMVLAVPAGHPLAGRERVAFEETLDHEHVGMHRGSAANDMLLRAANAFDRPLRMRFFVTSYDAMIAMVKAGLGIGLIPQKSIALYDAGELSVIELTDAWASRKLKLCVRPGDDLSAAGQMLLAHLRASDDAQ